MKTTLIILILFTYVELSFGQADTITLMVPDSEYSLIKYIEDVGLRTSGIYSEKSPVQIDKDQTREKKWSFSFFGGFSFIGSGADIKNAMKASGFGDLRPAHSSWLGHIPPKNYPINKLTAVWNFETRYNVSQKRALNFTAGKINHAWVNGFDKSYSDAGGSYQNYLQINSDLWFASFNYVWRTGRYNDGFSLGPVIAWHKIIAGRSTPFPDNSSTPSTIKAGYNLAYVYALVQKKSWFLSLKANYTWLPDIEIGPFTRGDREHESVFKETQLRLSTFNFGITTGWRW